MFSVLRALLLWAVHTNAMVVSRQQAALQEMKMIVFSMYSSVDQLKQENLNYKETLQMNHEEMEMELVGKMAQKLIQQREKDAIQSQQLMGELQQRYESFMQTAAQQ